MEKRKILFRCKDREKGTWFYGNFFQLYNGNTLKSFIIMTTNANYETYQNQVDPKYLGQSIGVIDWNGNEIFEGDIILSYRPEVKENDNNEEIWQIKIDNLKALTSPKEGFAFDNSWIDHRVIGNIYDNPELLKK